MPIKTPICDFGQTAKDFELKSINNEFIKLNDAKGENGTLIMFICNHCPFVHHINSKLVELANNYQTQGIQFIAISSNNVETHPQDGPEQMKVTAHKESYPFPYLYDESQEVARAYGAECTPDIFVFDGKLSCSYRGRFDETRPNMGEATGKDLRQALDQLLLGETPSAEQIPSIGCNIKWK